MALGYANRLQPCVRIAADFTRLIATGLAGGSSTELIPALDQVDSPPGALTARHRT
jgi:hypothetical protein